MTVVAGADVAKARWESPTMPDLIGRTLGHYRIVEEIGTTRSMVHSWCA
jgi:hypothetical protein